MVWEQLIHILAQEQIKKMDSFPVSLVHPNQKGFVSSNCVKQLNINNHEEKTYMTSTSITPRSNNHIPNIHGNWLKYLAITWLYTILGRIKWRKHTFDEDYEWKLKKSRGILMKNSRDDENDIGEAKRRKVDKMICSFWAKKLLDDFHEMAVVWPCHSFFFSFNAKLCLKLDPCRGK